MADTHTHTHLLAAEEALLTTTDQEVLLLFLPLSVRPPFIFIRQSWRHLHRQCSQRLHTHTHTHLQVHLQVAAVLGLSKRTLFFTQVLSALPYLAAVN